MQVTDSTLTYPEKVIKESKNEDFNRLQEGFSRRFKDIFSNDLAEKTVIIIPSLTMEPDLLRTIKGVAHYEERMLCLLMLLRMPRTNVIFVSSVPIDTTIIDYYLYLLPGITGYHARQRLTLLSCYDASRLSLTEKILARPRLMKRILQHVKDPGMAHIACFNVTEYEKELALQLQIPIFGADPALNHLGTKSGSRKLFRKCNIPFPAGFEDIRNEEGIVNALAQLKKENPGLRKAVVKLDDGFSGEGNAIFSYEGIDANDHNITEIIANKLPRELKIVAQQVSYPVFMSKFEMMSGIVEAFIDGNRKTSPSVQCRVTPDGAVEILSTHDQVLGGESGQIYLGAQFPASPDYAVEIGNMGKALTEGLKNEGVLGRFAIDFLSVHTDEGWKHFAIEVNLRKGGTTHPFLMLQFLTAGEYYWQEGVYRTANGGIRCYFTSDNLYNEKYKGLTPHDLIDIAVYNKLMYDSVQQCGVMFHMIGALSQYGKLGLLCIGPTIEEAQAYYQKTVEVLNKECGVT